jgi:hypothetical protein
MGALFFVGGTVTQRDPVFFCANADWSIKCTETVSREKKKKEKQWPATGPRGLFQKGGFYRISVRDRE